MRATGQRDVSSRINEHDPLDSNVGIALTDLSPERIGSSVHVDTYLGEIEPLQFLNESTSEASAQCGQLQAELRRAVERQEFRICYQPIVQLERGKIGGFEA